jgi:hypothetical protein
VWDSVNGSCAASTGAPGGRAGKSPPVGAGFRGRQCCAVSAIAAPPAISSASVTIIILVFMGRFLPCAAGTGQEPGVSMVSAAVAAARAVQRKNWRVCNRGPQIYDGHCGLLPA